MIQSLVNQGGIVILDAEFFSILIIQNEKQLVTKNDNRVIKLDAPV